MQSVDTKSQTHHVISDSIFVTNSTFVKTLIFNLSWVLIQLYSHFQGHSFKCVSKIACLLYINRGEKITVTTFWCLHGSKVWTCGNSPKHIYEINFHKMTVRPEDNYINDVKTVCDW